MALAAGDAQMMYEEEREYEAIHGDPEAIHRLQSHTSRHPAGDLPPTADNASDLTVTLAPKKHAHHSESTETGIDYRYLEWSTRLQELSKFPEDLESLPAVVTQVVDPFLWGRAHKNIVLTLCCASTFVAAYTAGAYTSGINQMEAEWGIGRVPLLVGLTIYTTGFAMAPMMLAPLSEVYGRRSVFILSYALFNVCHLACALTPSYAGMLVARFFLGVGGSTFSTLCGGVIADIYHAKYRGFPMACFSTMAFFGTGAGPLVSGFIADNLSWRWIHWIQLIMNGILLVAVALLFKETRGSVLLISRAKAINAHLDAMDLARMGSEKSEAETNKIRWKVQAEEERASLSHMIRVSLTRPFFLLFTEPVVFFFSLWAAFSWGVLYLFLQGVPLVFRTSHGFTVSQTGTVFTSMCVASLVALALNTLIERITPKFFPHASGPETRLYASCILGSFLPIGMFWFGWTSFPSQHWILPTIAVGVATVGIYFIYLAVFNYFADTYHRYASSALAAQSFCRNMLGGAFPLVTDLMYNRMTFQGASSFLGGVGLVLSVVPWVLVIYGDRVRRRSKFASEIMV